MSAAGYSPGVTTLLAVTLGLVSLALPATALGAGRVALVIGNAAYEEAPLRNPVNDARAMAAALDGLGFEVIRLENATKEQMERAVAKFTTRLEDDSSGLFYYAGHGIQIRGRNYLVPVGTSFQSQQEARIESVGMDLVLDELAYAGNRLNIVILDACRNNPFERRLRGASRGLAAIDAARGTLIAYATAPGSVALDGEGRNGLYTEELLRALRRPGMKIEEVFKQVRVQVTRRTQDQQIPWESSSLTGEFVFNPVSANVSLASPTNRQREAIVWENAERIGTVRAYRVYLEQYRNGVYSKLAAFRIAELDAGDAPIDAASDESYRIAVMKPAYFYPWGGSPKPNNVGGLGGEIYETIRQQPSFSITHADEPADPSALAYLNRGGDWPFPPTNVDPKEAWQGGIVYKTPNLERVNQAGRELEVDAVVMWFYSATGGGHNFAEYPVDVYAIDVEKQRVYVHKGLNTGAEALVRQALDDFRAGR